MNTAFKRLPQIQAPCLLDFYKVFHRLAYNPGTSTGVTEVLINFTGRHGKHSNLGNNTHYMWAGSQSFIDDIIVDVWGEFFEAPKEVAIAAYKRVNEGGLGVPCDTTHIEALHDLGYMPLEFRGLPEGVAVPYGVAALTVRNTHPDFFWLPNFIETIMSDEIWPIQTSLTTAAAYMKNVRDFAAVDGTPQELIPFLCHDFSMRGLMGGRVDAAAGLSGLGHLMAGFAGSDTLPAALRAEKHYGAYLGLDRPFETIASVPATEHSVQCSYKGQDKDYILRCMAIAPEGILSIVADGYDFWHLVTVILPEIKDEIMARPGKVVIRPDSGDPADILCGDSVELVPEDADLEGWVEDTLSDLACSNQEHGEPGEYEVVGLFRQGDKTYRAVLRPFWNRHDKRYYYYDGVDSLEIEETEFTAEQKGLIEVLYDEFGGTEQGEVDGNVFKFLDEHIGAIYGDSITLERQHDIYTRLHAKGFAIGNVVLGVGSYTYQYVTRDTHGSAVKATNMILDGVDTPIQKEVKTDTSKKSAKGRLVVRYDEDTNDYTQYDEATLQEVESPLNHLQRLWRDGSWIRVRTLENVRNNVSNNLDKLYA